MNLFYREEGEEFPIVIVHGLYGSSDNWLTVDKKLSSNYKVYMIDQRPFAYIVTTHIPRNEKLSGLILLSAKNRKSDFNRAQYGRKNGHVFCRRLS